MSVSKGPQFCPRCGRNLEADFRFCPSCGRVVDEIPSFDDVLDSSFLRIGAIEALDGVARLTALDELLRDLERYFDELPLDLQRLHNQRR